MQILHSGVYLHFYMHYALMHFICDLYAFLVKRTFKYQDNGCLEYTKACTLAFWIPLSEEEYLFLKQVYIKLEDFTKIVKIW